MSIGRPKKEEEQKEAIALPPTLNGRHLRLLNLKDRFWKAVPSVFKSHLTMNRVCETAFYSHMFQDNVDYSTLGRYE